MKKTAKNVLVKRYLRAGILLAACVFILSASVGKARAYFSTFAVTRGGYTFKDSTNITETVDKAKHIQVTYEKGTTPVYVRVKAVTAREYEKYLDYNSNGDTAWVDRTETDGYWYYTRALDGAQTENGNDSTSVLDVVLKDVPAKEKDAQSFNIIVVYEKTPADEGSTWQQCWGLENGGGQ